ncbi:MAG TPA: transglycosylase family protein [Candidatus Dormibacteraeota bacterium]
MRALALAFTVLIAHVAALLPHPHAHQRPATSTTRPVPNARLIIPRRREIDGVVLAAAVLPASTAATAPPARPIAAPAPSRYSGTIQQIIQQAFAPLGAGAVTWAERVARCESGDNPSARNPSGASGLFQIMPGTWAGTPYASQSPFDAVANARAAAWIYARRGGSAWSCS